MTRERKSIVGLGRTTHIDGVAVSTTAMSLPPGITEERWANIARQVTQVGYGYWWWIGDLANYATHNFKDPAEHIEALAAATGSGVKYVRLVAYAAKRYPVRQRVEGLSIQHHLVVMTLSPTRRHGLLVAARDKGWPARVLKEKSMPRDERKITVVIKAPVKVLHGPFLKQLKAVCDLHDADFYVWGTRKPTLAAARIRIGRVLTGGEK